MANLNYQSAAISGTALNFVAASAGGDAVTLRQHAVLLVKNGDSTSTTVTIVTPGNDKYGQARPDIPITVAAGATTVIGPFQKDLLDPTTKKIGLTYSKVTSLTIAGLGV